MIRLSLGAMRLPPALGIHSITLPYPSIRPELAHTRNEIFNSAYPLAILLSIVRRFVHWRSAWSGKSSAVVAKMQNPPVEKPHLTLSPGVWWFGREGRKTPLTGVFRGQTRSKSRAWLGLNICSVCLCPLQRTHFRDAQLPLNGEATID